MHFLPAANGAAFNYTNKRPLENHLPLNNHFHPAAISGGLVSTRARACHFLRIVYKFETRRGWDIIFPLKTHFSTPMHLNAVQWAHSDEAFQEGGNAPVRELGCRGSGLCRKDAIRTVPLVNARALREGVGQGRLLVVGWRALPSNEQTCKSSPNPNFTLP